MSKNIVVVSTSIRPRSNSERLARRFAEGAKEAGNQVELISLKGKQIGFCKGCLACQKTGVCVIKDDAVEIEKKVCEADVVVWASPIYYYGMSGQMKTLIDRLNPLYVKPYRFKDVYFLATATEDAASTPLYALGGVKGWVECFKGVTLKGCLFAGGYGEPASIEGSRKLDEAYEMGKSIN